MANILVADQRASGKIHPYRYSNRRTFAAHEVRCCGYALNAIAQRTEIKIWNGVKSPSIERYGSWRTNMCARTGTSYLIGSDVRAK
jgi:hypothetical protein